MQAPNPAQNTQCLSIDHAFLSSPFSQSQLSFSASPPSPPSPSIQDTKHLHSVFRAKALQASTAINQMIHTLQPCQTSNPTLMSRYTPFPQVSNPSQLTLPTAGAIHNHTSQCQTSPPPNRRPRIQRTSINRPHSHRAERPHNHLPRSISPPARRV